jgi:acetate kinase
VAVHVTCEQVSVCEARSSNSRGCEIGLSQHGGIPYQSIVYLVDRCTLPAGRVWESTPYMNVFVLNCGSSSAKFAVIHPNSGRELISGIAQRLGSPQASLDWKREGAKASKPLPDADHATALRAVVALLEAEGLAGDLGGVGHRVVHGGAKFSGSMPLTPDVLHKVEECIPLGPLHNPPNLVGIRIAQELFPNLPQIGVFDTAFHQTMPPKAYIYPVPYDWYEQHQVRRYGFHGTSHRFVAHQTMRELGLPPDDHAIITAHLGNGCSCAAVKDGVSVDTTMGLTPLEGVVMGTRSGSVDPAIVGYMSNALGQPADKILDALNKESGLLGVSGLSNDMRTVEEAATKGHERAKLAVEIFCYVLAKSIASLVVPLGRLDALAFTGGIGENAVSIRARVVGLLGFLGLTIDPAANAAAVSGHGHGGRITFETRPQAVVVPTNEELMIATDTAEIVARGRASAA